MTADDADLDLGSAAPGGGEVFSGARKAGVRVLSPKQQSRRTDVVEAALELGRKGGYAAVQMREVASEANVALGTPYHYFSSKDHLLAEAMAAWAEQLSGRIDTRPLKGSTAAEQLSNYYTRACHALASEPALTSAMVTALASTDTGVARSVARLNADVTATVTAVLDGHYQPEVCRGIVSVLGHVWYSSLISWVSGRRSLDEVAGELEKAIGVLCRGAETPSSVERAFEVGSDGP
ncbi:MAG: TetR/AcrR family transcriptional regulator [Acidimicrobiales bacterium]|nr:TetR/AcrR family transcriptional regulator [Acidimicrobiales bacterium]